MIYEYKGNAEDFFGLVKCNIESNKFIRKELKISDLKIDGKTIIVLSGNNTKNPVKASSYAGCCFAWLEDYSFFDTTNSYCIYYPSSQPLLNSMKPNPAFNYDALADIVFDQILYKNGKVRSVKKITDTLGEVVFFGHSMGGFVMDELMERLEGKLRKENFSEPNIDKVFSSIVFVGYAPYTLVKKPINSVYVTPIYDSVGSIKLVLERFKKNTGVISSEPKLNISSIYKVAQSSQENFIRRYKNAIDDQDIIYFLDKRTLVATPNLMYDDGIKEDHNLAGVINYSTKNLNKTEAGEVATKFMKDVFRYSMSIERKDFSVKDLYFEEIQDVMVKKEKNNSIKE